jgi:hypothetical protein
MQPLVAYNFGQQQFERVRKTIPHWNLQSSPRGSRVVSVVPQSTSSALHT